MTAVAAPLLPWYYGSNGSNGSIVWLTLAIVILSPAYIQQTRGIYLLLLSEAEIHSIIISQNKASRLLDHNTQLIGSRKNEN